VWIEEESFEENKDRALEETIVPVLGPVGLRDVVGLETGSEIGGGAGIRGAASGAE
jgi:hypothetical protein